MALQTANVDGLEMVLKRIDHAILFSKKDMAEDAQDQPPSGSNLRAVFTATG
jgi:hypothetical protein